MYGIIVILSLAFVMQSFASELAANHTDDVLEIMDDSVDKSFDDMVDNLMDRALEALPHQHADLYNTMLRKPSNVAIHTSHLSPPSAFPTGQFRPIPHVMAHRLSNSAAGRTRSQPASHRSRFLRLDLLGNIIHGQGSRLYHRIQPVMAGDATAEVVGRRSYKDIFFNQWFGEEDVYNLPPTQLNTLTAGKTTRLVKDDTTGNVLLGYKEKREITITDPSSITLEPGELDKGVAINTVPSSSWASVGESGPVPGDVVIELNAGGETLNCEGSTVDAASEFLAKSPGPVKMDIVRERFIPAWMEQKVWQEPKELQMTYFNEQKYMIAQKSADKNFRTSPGLNTRDVTIFEKGRKEASGVSGFGKFKQFLKRSEKKGEGSFGDVFDGVLKDSTPIVLKRPKLNVVGASEMLQLELLLNQEVKKWVKPEIFAPFLGYIEVPEEEEGQIYDGYLSTGLWLLFEDLGAVTLDNYLAEASSEKLPEELAQKMDLAGKDPTRTILMRVFEAIAALHEQGFVDRDIKPENLLVLEGGRLSLIDLGSTASCLHKILSYEVGAGPFDPAYTAEADQYLLPAGTQRPERSNLQELWEQLQPSKFDIYSAGTLLLQLACPTLRTREALLKFQSGIKAANYNLESYRQSSGLKSALLDADDGAGWDLATRCLKLDRAQRPTAQEALAHRFFSEPSN